MEASFEKLDELKKEVMNSNLSDETKKIVISSLTEVFFDQIREQGRIEDNIAYYHKK